MKLNQYPYIYHLNISICEYLSKLQRAAATCCTSTSYNVARYFESHLELPTSHTFSHLSAKLKTWPSFYYWIAVHGSFVDHRAREITQLFYETPWACNTKFRFIDGFHDADQNRNGVIILPRRLPRFGS